MNSKQETVKFECYGAHAKLLTDYVTVIIQ